MPLTDTLSNTDNKIADEQSTSERNVSLIDELIDPDQKGNITISKSIIKLNHV